MSFQTYPSKRDELYITSLQAMSGIKFTLREIDVIACIANNRGTKKIASILSISPRTASTHMYNIMSKLQTNSRDHIIDFVQKAGKLSDMRLYYFNILTEAAFTKMLASIKKLLVNQKSGYSLEFNQSSEKEQSFTKQLTHYLSIANINLIDGKSIEKAPQFFISSAGAYFALALLPGLVAGAAALGLAKSPALTELSWLKSRWRLSAARMDSGVSAAILASKSASHCMVRLSTA